VATIGTAHADTTDDVIGQAIAELNQGAAILDAAPTVDLSAKQADLLLEQATLSSQLSSALPLLESGQDGLSPVDQTFLADADQQLVSVDQAFVAADQAGELTGSGLSSPDLAFLDADLGFLGAAFDATIASLLASVDPDIGTVVAVDPSIAGLLTAFG
jgi:hypothetical protein